MIKVSVSANGSLLPEGRALSITRTSIPARAAALRASAMVASGMKKGDWRNTCRCAEAIMKA